MESQAGTLLFSQQMVMDAVQDKDEAKTNHRRVTIIMLRNNWRVFLSSALYAAAHLPDQRILSKSCYRPLHLWPDQWAGPFIEIHNSGPVTQAAGAAALKYNFNSLDWRQREVISPPRQGLVDRGWRLQSAA